jgi:hypothetical protein
MEKKKKRTRAVALGVAEDGVVSGRVSDGESVVVCNLDSEFIISISSPFSTSPSSLSLSSTTW